MVEQNADAILAGAADQDVAFLVVGDPLGYVCVLWLLIALCWLSCQLTKPFFRATTHTDLILRAVERSIPYKVICCTLLCNTAFVCVCVS